MPAEIRLILKWFVFWLSAHAIPSLILKFYGFAYLDYYPVSSLYFIITALIGIKFLNYKYQAQNLKTILCLAVAFIVIQLTWNFYYPLTNEVELLLTKRKIFSPLFEFRTSLIKACDITFQQLLILALVSRLKEIFNNDKKVIYYFSIAFLILHFPLFYIFGFTAIIFIVPAGIAGFAFALVILKHKHGFAYSFALHFFFYIVLGLIMRQEWFISLV